MAADRAQPIEFGWFMLGGAVPLLVAEEPDILPLVAEHFDSIWVPDHFYAFDDPVHAWVECWTALTWLAARYPRLRVGPIVLGVGYRHPALLAKMAATLQTLSGAGSSWASAPGGARPNTPRTAIRSPRPRCAFSNWPRRSRSCA